VDISLGLVEVVANLWLKVRPWRRLKVWRNTRRVAKGKKPLQLSEDDMALFPKNTMRKGGVGLMALAPIVAVGLGFVGVGECTPEQVEAGCQGAAEIAAAIMGGIGGVLYWLGRNRAEAEGK
jgi:hypothetical protein